MVVAAPPWSHGMGTVPEDVCLSQQKPSASKFATGFPGAPTMEAGPFEP